MTSGQAGLLLGEFRRLYDERYRVALPTEVASFMGSDNAECVLAKEQTGCLSLWRSDAWKDHFDTGLETLNSRYRSGKYNGELFATFQEVCRLISTRSRPVQLGQRGRLLIPEGFREFLQAEPGGEVIVVGSGACAEIWNPKAFADKFTQSISSFQSLYRSLI